MQALFEMNVGKRRLVSILEKFPAESSHWNEAQNRFQFIDRLLIECLGWERPNIEVEVYDDLGGRADYLLGKPCRAVLEAKREAKYFETLPIGRSSIVRKMQPFLQASKEFESAVHQVIPYCAMNGAQIAIVCNGPQLAVFQAIIPGMSPLNGECYLFNGFQSYLDDFPLLWTLLSPEGVFENRGYRQLGTHRNPRLPQKASASIVEPYRFRYRNSFQENLRDLGALLLEEIQENPNLRSDFYRECYVPIDANSHHLLLSKGIILNRYRRVTNDGSTLSPAQNVAGVDEQGELTLHDPNISSAMGSRPVVVIGDVGVGKTSFFKNLFESLDSSEKANTYFIHIDLGIDANLAPDIRSHILDDIPATLDELYGIDISSTTFVDALYASDLEAFDKSVPGKFKGIDLVQYERAKVEFLMHKVNRHDAHLHASLAYLAREQRKQIVLVIDNADQRTFEVQQQAFLIAQELAATRSLLVFVALRPSTFYQSKMTGTLSAYQNKLLTITPPPADQVISKRLAFAVRVAEGKIAPATLQGITLQARSVVLLLNALLRSIRVNEEIRQFLVNITAGNTRAVIELITSFIGSPNVDSQKIIYLLENGVPGYIVPVHEFTKHALLGDYAYFNALSSLVASNIFDISLADPREHFLASLVITFLGSHFGTRNSDGFMMGSSVIAEMALHGYLDDQVRASLKKLASKRLIETPHAHYRETTVEDSVVPDAFLFRATSVGLYHVNFWTGSFSFMDATSIDTPIFDEKVRDLVAKSAESFEIADRLSRASAFQGYLENQWQLANVSAPYYDFSALSKHNSKGFESVRRALQRLKGAR